MRGYTVQLWHQFTGWIDRGHIKNLTEAQEKAEKVFRKARKRGWYRVRVVDDSGERVYPPKKQPGE